MDTNLQGNIGEAIAVNYFIENHYEVYLPFGTAAKCDMIVYKGGVTQRVSVKTASTKASTGKWRVRIRQGKLNKQTVFDPSSSDLLFIYILPESRIVILNSKDVGEQTEITI